MRIDRKCTIDIDDARNIAYLCIVEGMKVSRSERVMKEAITLDFAADGTLVGIELLDASRFLPLGLEVQ